MKYDKPGIYELTYTAVDDCGNTTEQVRTINVIAVTKSTVLFSDGTLIINELSTDRDANISKHGAVTDEFDPGPYTFETQSDIPWLSYQRDIATVEFGSTVKQTSCKRLFNQLYYATDIDLTGLDTSECTNMAQMFSGCTRLANVNTELLDTSNVVDMAMMFYDCFKSVEASVDLSSFDTEKVTTMQQMFRNCSKLTTIYASDKYVTDQVTASNSMFVGATSIVGGNGTVYDASFTDKTYARIDKAQTPGYFTAK